MTDKRLYNAHKIRPYKLVKASHLLLSESAKTCNETFFNISRISRREFCCLELQPNVAGFHPTRSLNRS